MSAIVCGKRSFFEDLTTTPPVSKRIRCSSSSPVRFSPPRSISASPSQYQSPASQPSVLDHLRAIFPDMDKQFLEKALEECGNDLDSAIKSLNELRLGSAENNLGFVAGTSDLSVEPKVQIQSQVSPRYLGSLNGRSNTNVHVAGVAVTNGEVLSSEDPSAPKNLPVDGAEWVELFVREMMSASNMDDARARASRALEILEKSISARASAEAAQSLHQENLMLKEQVEALLQENIILKRAVAIQHDRQKESEERNQELQHLKQMVSQYQEQLRTLEVNNYALSMHLRQAQQSSSIPGHFHPDVF